MPYISNNQKINLKLTNEPQSAGELNYTITQICVKYLGDNISYNKINEIMGVLECAKQEFYRRVATKYEDQKMGENGDVYF